MAEPFGTLVRDTVMPAFIRREPKKALVWVLGGFGLDTTRIPTTLAI